MSMRVLFVVEAGDTPCAYYRAMLPAKGLRELGFRCDVVSSMVQLDDGTITGFDGQHLTQIPDVVVCRRIDEPVEGTANDSGRFASIKSMIKRAQKRGQRVFIDVDDNSWNVPPWNPAHGNLQPYELDLWCEDMRQADGVLCSTEYLASVVAIHAGVSPYVCRNSIDRGVYQYRRNRLDGEPTRLAIPAHLGFQSVDVETILPTLFEFLADRDDVELWHLGATKHDHFVDTPVPVVEVPWQNVSKLPRILSSVDCAIIPLKNHPFNHARSNVRGLALCAAGVPFIAPSWHDEYQHLWHVGGGYLYDPDDFRAVLALLTDKEYVNARDDMRAGGYRAAEVHGYKRMALAYEALFTRAGGNDG